MGFLLVDLVLEGLEVVSMMYESEESWEMVSQLVTQEMVISYFGIQFILGSLVPLVILGIIVLVKLREQIKTPLMCLSSALVLIGVFAMRWNVVIGGQLLSKSLRGFTSYTPSLMGKEGILSALAILILPLVIFAIMSYFIPPWGEELEEETVR